MPQSQPDPQTFAWLYDTYIAGGASSVNTESVIDLRGGDYGVWADDPTSPLAAAPLTVTGDPDARVEGAEPQAAVTIVEEGSGGQGFKFTVTGEAKPGPQIVKILNASDQPHFVIGFHYPEKITIEQAMEFITFDPSSATTPSPNMLDETLLTFPIYAPVQSVGATQWVELNGESGSVIIVCFVPDPCDGRHSARLRRYGQPPARGGELARRRQGHTDRRESHASSGNGRSRLRPFLSLRHPVDYRHGSPRSDSDLRR